MVPGLLLCSVPSRTISFDEVVTPSVKAHIRAQVHQPGDDVLPDPLLHSVDVFRFHSDSEVLKSSRMLPWHKSTRCTHVSHG